MINDVKHELAEKVQDASKKIQILEKVKASDHLAIVNTRLGNTEEVLKVVYQRLLTDLSPQVSVDKRKRDEEIGYENKKIRSDIEVVSVEHLRMAGQISLLENTVTEQTDRIQLLSVKYVDMIRRIERLQSALPHDFYGLVDE
jgi:hypothetical protein